MSQGADSPVGALTAGRSAEPARALSEQQRVWVREVVERLKKQRHDNRLRSHSVHGARSDGTGRPAR